MTRSRPACRAQCPSQVLVATQRPEDLFYSASLNDLMSARVPSSSVCKKHGKLVTFLRTFMKSRPPPQKLRQRGILKERVFGCDLGEHLHSSEHEGEFGSLTLQFHLISHQNGNISLRVQFPVLKRLLWMFSSLFT